jgi:hypothetical protein
VDWARANGSSVQRRYPFDRARRADFLGVARDELPTYRDWPRILLALRELDRWLDNPRPLRLHAGMRGASACQASPAPRKGPRSRGTRYSATQSEIVDCPRVCGASHGVEILEVDGLVDVTDEIRR